MAQQTKVSTNLQQDFTDNQQKQARKNIGASNVKFLTSYSAYGPIYTTGDTILVSNTTHSLNVEFGDGTSQQYAGLVPIPASGDVGKILAVTDANSGYGWERAPEQYDQGDGILFVNNLSTGKTDIEWAYKVGRNLHINQNDYIQTDLPGGVWNAPTTMSNNFTAINGSNFAGAYKLGCKYYDDKYQLAIIYTASSTTSNIQFIGTETVIGTDNSCTVNQAVYNETALYTPVYRFGYSSSTVFDPSVHKAIIYNGIGLIGPCSDCKIAIWNDNGTVKIGMTAIEVGRVGSTL